MNYCIFRSCLSFARKFSSNAFIGSKINDLFILPISSRRKIAGYSFNHCIAIRYRSTKPIENVANEEANEKLSEEIRVYKETNEKLPEENEANEKVTEDDATNKEENEKLTDENSIKEQLDAYIQSDPENARRYKLLQLEIELLRQNGDKVPNSLKPHHWSELFEKTSSRQRQRFLSFLWKNELKKNISHEKKLVKYNEHLENVSTDTDDNQYKLGKNSMFIRIYDSTMNFGNHSRLMNAMLYGQKLVFDCGYDEYMSSQEISSCVKQLMFAFASNREHIDPYDIYFCNLHESSKLMGYLTRALPTIHEPDFPLNITSKSYLDMFDKDRLVYLTPHCQNEMQHYDKDAVYIIGALVDKVKRNPLSLAKAKREGLKMAKLPLSKHLKWGPGSGKNLNVNHVFDILLTKRFTGDWTEALKHVPIRKLAPYREYRLQQKIEDSFAKSRNMKMTNKTYPDPIDDDFERE